LSELKEFIAKPRKDALNVSGLRPFEDAAKEGEKAPEARIKKAVSNQVGQSQIRTLIHALLEAVVQHYVNRV
jgi:hypothetical protein